MSRRKLTLRLVAPGCDDGHALPVQTYGEPVRLAVLRSEELSGDLEVAVRAISHTLKCAALVLRSDVSFELYEESCDTTEPAAKHELEIKYGPQIGGYSTRYLVERLGSCFDVRAFTDGDFPLSENNPGEPVAFHLCDALQVVNFGIKLLGMLPAKELDDFARADIGRSIDDLTEIGKKT